MIEEKMLKDLFKYKKRGFPVTSAYVSTANRSGSRRSHIVELKKMMRYKKSKTYFKQLPEPEQNSVLLDFDRILHWVTEEFDSSKYYSTICFSSHGSGLWQTINLKQPLENELFISPKPYIRPLTILSSVHRNYAIVLIDRAKARIFEHRLGEYIEHFYITDNSPELVKVGGFKGRQERKVERNIHQAVMRHYKQVAHELFSLNQKYLFNWIIIGGRKEAINEFQKHLHDYVASKVHGMVLVEPSAPLTEVLDCIKITESKAHQEYEKKLLLKLNDKIQVAQGVEGIHAILQTIRKNLIETFIIHENYKCKGVFCRNCDYLDLNPGGQCYECGGPLERTNDLVEHLLHVALSHGVIIEHVKRSMTKYGEIAAILRYPLTGPK